MGNKAKGWLRDSEILMAFASYLDDIVTLGSKIKAEGLGLRGSMPF